MRRFCHGFFVATFLMGCFSSARAEFTTQTVSPLGPISSGGKQAYNPSVFNPAIGLVLDAAASHTTLNRGDFDFRSAELNLLAAVDPFANLYAVINGTDAGLEVEEAAFMTTQLPYNLTVRGGRFFANFGRLAHWHDHELPFVNRVPSLNAFIGGESKSDGVELIHLFKTPFFLQGTLGAYNKMGSDNHRLDQTDGGGNGHTNGRPLDAFTYLSRLFSYVPLGDDYGIDMGISEALTPRQYYISGSRVDSSLHTARSLTGVDVTFRYEPLSTNVYRKLLWGTELFRNDEVRPDPNNTTSLRRQTATAAYTYLDWHFAPRWTGGGFYDWAQNIDNPVRDTNTYGLTFNFIPSEFQRIRLQVSRSKPSEASQSDDQIFIQWFGTIGTHVHVFKDR